MRPSPRSLRRFIATTAGALALAGAVALAQISPDAPIRNFRLPFFENDGFRAWDLRGAEARARSPERVELVEMDLKVFRREPPGSIQVEIVAPHAVLRPALSEASGEDSIRIFNEDFEITGYDWTWHGRDNHVVIRRDVRVTFRAPLQDILK
jgi:hypothetical protein